MFDSHQAGGSQLEERRSEELLARVLYGVVFLMFFMIALSASIVGLKWRSWLPGAEQFTSLFQGVRAAASSVVPLMFT